MLESGHRLAMFNYVSLCYSRGLRSGAIRCANKNAAHGQSSDAGRLIGLLGRLKPTNQQPHGHFDLTDWPAPSGKRSMYTAAGAIRRTARPLPARFGPHKGGPGTPVTVPIP